MRVFFLGLIAAFVFTACNHSNSTTATGGTAANAAVMKFDKDFYDFGKIKSGDKVSYQFTFANTGSTPLIITDAVATCGCTKPEWPHEPIKPGDKGAIKVTFDSAHKLGRQDKQITITANTVPAQSVVHLVGEVATEK